MSPEQAQALRMRPHPPTAAVPRNLICPRCAHECRVIYGMTGCAVCTAAATPRKELDR
jgi:hypothetical protein